MQTWLFTASLVVFSSGCIPSTPTVTPSVTTTTVASTNVTTSTASPTNTTTAASTTASPNTTTAIPTTTVATSSTTPAPNCCGYPVDATGVNTADPVQSDWNNCNQSITISCVPSGNDVITAYIFGTLVNQTERQTNPIISGFVATTTLNCNGTAMGWYVGTITTILYNHFQCGYLFANGQVATVGTG